MNTKFSINLIRFSVLVLVSAFFFIACEVDRKVGDACSLLKPESDGVTKVERKNLDCMTVDSDALCLSYIGNDSYCTQKCGPERTCADVQCGDLEACIAAICIKKELACSPDNKKGQCEEGFKCDETEGVCKTTCEEGKSYIAGSCKDNTELCSPEKADGICGTGLKCTEEGKCVPTGCPSEYTCEAPIQLLGHPLKGLHVCVKSEESKNPCAKVDCSSHGECEVDEDDGKVSCDCDDGFTVSDTGLECNPDNEDD